MIFNFRLHFLYENNLHIYLSKLKAFYGDIGGLEAYRTLLRETGIDNLLLPIKLQQVDCVGFLMKDATNPLF